MSLKDQVAIITGGTSGIGTAVARELDQAGARLVLTGRRAERLQAAARELKHAATLQADIAEPDVPQRLIELAMQKFGRCDIVFNSAGVMEAGAFDTIDIERVCRMVRINVEAAFRMAFVAMRHFRRQGGGHLLNVSSILGTKVRPTTGAYAGTKFAIEALSEDLRMQAGGTGIRISVIEPGLVMTELHNHWEKHPKDTLNIREPLTAEDIARCVRFILDQPPHVRIQRMMITPGDQQL
jgi:NADP-dependent 3-hydroxy acid dehydrogenase YdfG